MLEIDKIMENNGRLPHLVILFVYYPNDIVGKWEYPIFASQMLTYYAKKWRMRVMTGMTVYLRLECDHTHM